MHPLETYLQSLHHLHTSSTGATESLFYPPLADLLNEVGETLKPKVRCLLNLKSIGAGLPDGGLFTADQFPKRSAKSELSGSVSLPAAPPTRGAIEIKSPSADLRKAAYSLQVVKHLAKYRQVLVVNYREFVLVGLDPQGRPIELESYRLASTEAGFWTEAAQPQALVQHHGDRLVDFLRRSLRRPAPLTTPNEVVWFLASYAREAHSRIESDLPLSASESPLQMALNNIRDALEDALGLTIQGPKGDYFFHSTLVQTLFYTIFSAWVLWHNENPTRQDAFDWRAAIWSLRLPVIQALFGQVAQPSSIGAHGLSLVEVFNWAGDTLNRVDRTEFFSHFEVDQSIPYFFEPFLQAFSPELRKVFDVWYTSPEIVQYMVARVDTALREELGLADGLADEQVYVLDPCSGTGSYIREVVRRIALTRQAQGAGTSDAVKKAVTERVFGFEIMPAPFVIAHLQLNLLLQSLGAPLASSERAGLYLTNALIGWSPTDQPKQHLLLSALEAERDTADAIKQSRKILVVLGNLPSNGFAGLVAAEERDLADAYRSPKGQGLNDLYLRFFRLAERQIVEHSGQGVICYISNDAWLDGPAYSGMREQYLEKFDKIWIDSLNGDKHRTGKLTPAGAPDPSVFSTKFNRKGSPTGAAITLLVRQTAHPTGHTIQFRNFWGRTKLAQLLGSAPALANEPSEPEIQPEPLQNETAERCLAGALIDPPHYQDLKPARALGLPFRSGLGQPDYLTWPLLPEIVPTSYSGLQSSRDDLIIDIDRERLVRRMEHYLDPKINQEQVRQLVPQPRGSNPPFETEIEPHYQRQRGALLQNIVRFSYRPLDLRWLYWHPATTVLDEKQGKYFLQASAGNIWLAGARRNCKSFDPPFITTQPCSRHVIEQRANLFPIRLQIETKGTLFAQLPRKDQIQPNLSKKALRYLASLGATPEADLLFQHVIAILYAPHYRQENGAMLWQDWPRLPLPDNVKLLQKSAALGQKIEALLNTEKPVPGITTAQIRPELKTIGLISRIEGGSLDPEADLALTAGWGVEGRNGVTIPGQGRFSERPFTADEWATFEKGGAALGLNLDQLARILGDTTLDVYLNEDTCWANIPLKVWNYSIGGYQVMKKWLSYREEQILGRPLKSEEAQEVTHMARRILAIVLLEPALNANYQAIKRATYVSFLS